MHCLLFYFKTSCYIIYSLQLKICNCYFHCTFLYLVYTTAVDLIIALDVSGSIGQRNFDIILDFLQNLISDLDIDSGLVRVGLVTFGTYSNIEFLLKDHQLNEDVQYAISRIFYRRGTTNTARALEDVRTVMTLEENGDRPNVPTAILILTDGRSDQPQDTLHQAKLLNLQGVSVLSVGIGQVHELLGMASEPRHLNTFYLDRFYDLHSLKTQLQEAVCNSKHLVIKI